MINGIGIISVRRHNQPISYQSLSQSLCNESWFIKWLQCFCIFTGARQCIYGLILIIRKLLFQLWRLCRIHRHHQNHRHRQNVGCDPSVCGSATWAQLEAAAVMRAMGQGGAALQEATVAKSNTNKHHGPRRRRSWTNRQMHIINISARPQQQNELCEGKQACNLAC